MGCIVTQPRVPFQKAMGSEIESGDDGGSAYCEDDGGGIGAVSRGRQVYTCNGSGAFGGNGWGEGKELEVKKGIEDAGDSN